MKGFNKTITEETLTLGIYTKCKIHLFGKIPREDIYVQSIDNEEETAMIKIGNNSQYYPLPKSVVVDYINNGCYCECKPLN